MKIILIGIALIGVAITIGGLTIPQTLTFAGLGALSGIIFKIMEYI